MILGIDISTSITGFAGVAEGEIVFYDSVDLRKYKNLFEKAERIKEAIFNIFDNYQFDRDSNHWIEIDQDAENKINHIYIEQSLHMFMGGKSSAKTCQLLRALMASFPGLFTKCLAWSPNSSVLRQPASMPALKFREGKKQNKLFYNICLTTSLLLR